METKIMLPARQIVFAAFVATLLAAAMQVQPADAAFGITSISGAIQPLLPPGPDVYPGSNEGALPIVFHEVLGGVIFPTALHPLGLDVDHDGSSVVAAPTISGNILNPLLVDTTIPTGTRFNSYMFHFDPIGSPFFAFYVTTINFDNPIIGVQLFSDTFDLEKPAGTLYTGTLEQGDIQVFGNAGPGPPLVYYPGGVDFRGLEEDAFVLTISGNTVMLAGSAHGPEIDQVRILTAAPVSTGVPELSSSVTWGMISAIAFCGIFFWQRQQKKHSNCIN